MKKVVLPFISTVAILVAGPLGYSQGKLPQLGEDPTSEVIKHLTLEQKVDLVVGKGFSVPGLKMVAHDTTANKITGISGYTVAIPALGIPSLGMADGPSGIHRFFMSAQDSADDLFATAWPVGTLLASSWDTSLVRKVGVAFGKEIKAYGIDFILGPGVNIHRNPLGGRNFEYYSEDPLLSGQTAAAMINGIQSQGVGATIKHFAANNQETDRNSIDEIISQRALREIYLRNFKIAIQHSHPWAIMSSYNKINGSYTSESHDLLTSILRDDWGYKGFVMSDWFGGIDAVAQMKAGNNLLMPGTPAQVNAILAAVRSGDLPEAQLDRNVEGILNIMVKTPTFKHYHFPNHADLKGDALIAREAAAESMVLLKNENHALPITHEGETIALFGNHGYDLITGGSGSGDVNKAYAVSLADGLTHDGYQLQKSVAEQYENYMADYKAKHPKKGILQEMMNPTPEAPEFALNYEGLPQTAESADMAIIYIGRNAGEGKDLKVQGDFELTSLEVQMIDSVTQAFHAKNKPVVAVLNIGCAMDLTGLKDEVDALLLAWQPGQEGGNAMADVLGGKVDPSGKLATTFPASYTDEPSSKNFPGKELPGKAVMSVVGRAVPAEVTYQEGIYVGYRYFSTFNVKPAYEFGYGLSYTDFSYKDLSLSSNSFQGKLIARVTITNTGKVAGKEVAELYLSAPHPTIDKPSEELKGFAKTRLLKPGQSETLVFTLKPMDLASYNTSQSAWIADPGKYEVKIGGSSEDIKLIKSFTLSKSILVEKVHNALAPQREIDELKP